MAFSGGTLLLVDVEDAAEHDHHQHKTTGDACRSKDQVQRPGPSLLVVHLFVLVLTTSLDQQHVHGSYLSVLHKLNVTD